MANKTMAPAGGGQPGPFYQHIEDLDIVEDQQKVTTGFFTGNVGTLTSATTFPAGHVLQMKVVHLPGSVGSISSNASGYNGVSQTDITVSRTLGTKLLYTLSGGGGYTNASGTTLRTLAKRTSGASYTGT